MSDLAVNFCGIKSPNPFWLASGPVTNTGAQVMRAFDMGWGGAVWKTLSKPITNTSLRLAASDFGGKRMMGLTNIEQASDRPLGVNLAEIYQVKKAYPKHVVIASIMENTKEDWHEITKRCVDAGVDGIELNFGCPHVKCELGMGSVVGQNPGLIKTIVGWVKEATTLPVIAKLTQMVTRIEDPAEAAIAGGADGLVLINTIRSINHLDLDRLSGTPCIKGKFTPGGYSGPAVKPIALNLILQLALHPKINVPISGIGGISNWRDAAEFVALGSSTVQVCTAVMHRGYGIIQNMIDGLSKYLDSKGMKSVSELVASAVPSHAIFSELDTKHQVVASIDKNKCVGCQACYLACRDGGHQCIHTTKEPCHAHHGENDHGMKQRLKQSPVQHEKTGDCKAHVPFVNEAECAGCGLCSFVCPSHCITMEEV